MTDVELMELPAARPGLRIHVSRDYAERQAALQQYRQMYHGQTDGGLIMTKHVRQELRELVQELAREE